MCVCDRERQKTGKAVTIRKYIAARGKIHQKVKPQVEKQHLGNPEQTPPMSGRAASERRKQASLGSGWSYVGNRRQTKGKVGASSMPKQSWERETLVSEDSSAERAPRGAHYS